MSRGAWRRDPVPPRPVVTKTGAALASDPAGAEVSADARHVPAALGVPPRPEPEPDPDPEPADPIPAPGPTVRHGGCLCGAVRFEVRGAPQVVGLCHCADCRKATGGYALHYADWPKTAVTLTGRLQTHAGRSFCPECGSRVVHFSERHTEILLGTLDDPPTDLVPQREGWIIRREPWVQPVPGAQQFERDPE